MRRAAGLPPSKAEAPPCLPAHLDTLPALAHAPAADKSLRPISGHAGTHSVSAGRLDQGLLHTTRTCQMPQIWRGRGSAGEPQVCRTLTGRALWRLVGELGTHTGVAALLVHVAASCSARPPSCGCPSPTKNSTGAWDSGCTGSSGCSGSEAAGWQVSVCTEAAFSSVTCTAASTAAAGSGCMLTDGAGGAWWSAGHATRQAAWVPSSVHQAIMLRCCKVGHFLAWPAVTSSCLPAGSRCRRGSAGQQAW